jgi:hypothetical protein
LVGTGLAVLYALATQFEQLSLLPGDGQRPPASDLNRLIELDDRVDTLNDVFLALIVITVITFMIWMFRAAKNNEALARPAPRFGPGWAIGGWLIPLANVVIPVLIMQDLWRGSDPSVPRGDTRWKIGNRSLLVGFWWGLLFFGRVFVAVGNSRFNDGSTIDDLRSAINLQIVGNIASVAAAVLGILVVRAITARQEECLRVQNEQWTQRGDAPTPPIPPTPPGPPVST